MGIRCRFSGVGGIKDRGFKYTTEVPEDNYTLEIPFTNGTYINPVDVDWGDGTTETLTSGTYPTHTYATAGDYQISLKSGTGKIPAVYFRDKDGWAHPQAAQQIKSVDHLFCTWYVGSSIHTSINYMFSGCKKITGEIPRYICYNNPNITQAQYAFTDSTFTGIPKELFENNTRLSNFNACFQNCQSLTYIPSGLFDNCVAATNFQAIFRSCTGLTGGIPASLFDGCPNVTNFGYTFYLCSGLNGTLPSNLFDGKTKATTFSYCFSGDKFLTGSLSSNFFRNCEKASTFVQTFYNCQGLTGSLPSGLLDDCEEATSFYQMFANCSGLTGSIPTGFFDNNPLVTQFRETFSGCHGLTGSIPTGLFDNNEVAWNFYCTFSGCDGLTGSIPSGLFDNCPEASNFYATFQNCAGLTGSIPSGLFDNNDKATTFQNTFSGCSELTGSIPTGLFDNNPLVNNFSGTFNSCHKLSGSIPSGLFANNPLVTTFYNIFSGCNNLSGSIPANLFSACPLVTTFRSVFYNCYNLTGAIPAGLFANNTAATTFITAFRSCTGLTSAPDNLFANEAGYDFDGVFQGCDKLEMSPNIFGTDYENRFASLTSKAVFLFFHYLQSTTWHGGDPGTAPDVWDTNKWTYASGMEPATTYQSIAHNYAFTRHNRNSLTNWYSVPQNWGGPTPPGAGKLLFSVDVPANTTISFTSSHPTATINWGDSSSSATLAQGTNSHTYTTAGLYTITTTCSISTAVPYIHFSDLGAYLVSVDYVNGKVSNNQMLLTSVAGWFSGCTNLTYVHSDLLKGAVDITNVSSLFAGCSSLKEIPYQLFANTARTALDGSSAITNFDNCFTGCSSLKTIPAGLFDICTNAETFSSCFSFCTNLESADGVFANNLKAYDYGAAFYGCPKLVLSSDMFGANIGNRFSQAGQSVNFDGCFSLGSEQYAGSKVGTAPALWSAMYPSGNSHNQIFFGHSISSISNHVMAQASGWT